MIGASRACLGLIIRSSTSLLNVRCITALSQPSPEGRLSPLHLDRGLRKNKSVPSSFTDVVARLWCSMATLCTSSKPGYNPTAVRQNKQINDLAKRGEWRGLLDFAYETQFTFNGVNWATTFSRLGRFKKETGIIVQDARFRSLLTGLEGAFEPEGGLPFAAEVKVSGSECEERASSNYIYIYIYIYTHTYTYIYLYESKACARSGATS